MVMKRNAMQKNLLRSIGRSLGRYIAIAAIIALGAAIFVGLLMTKTDMVNTGQAYMTEQNMFDLRLVSTYGWEQKQVDQVQAMDGVVDAEGIFYLDLIAQKGEEKEEKVYRFYTISDKLDQIALRGGRMPENSRECLADGYFSDDSILGKQIQISQNNDADDLDIITTRPLTVVGYVSTPVYMDMNRGTTTVGSGSISGFVYVPQDTMDADYFTEIHLTIPREHDIYTDDYNDQMKDAMDAMEPEAKRLGQERFDDVKAEAEEEYLDGCQEYEDGLKEFEEKKADAEKELADALKELEDGEQEIKDNYRKLQNAERSLYEGKVQIEEGLSKVRSGKQQVAEAKAQAEAQKPALDAGKAALEAATGMSLSELSSAIAAAPGKIQELDAAIKAETDEAVKAQLIAQRAQLQALLGYSAQVQSIVAGYAAIEQLQAKERELKGTEADLEEKLDTVKKNITKVYNGYEDLKDAKQELADGWDEYYDAKEEAEQEIADAEAELEDARQELEDARKEIDDMDKPDVILLDRNSNLGYNSLSSSSDIVQGVARVFPAFFLLIAALVCITTMTRMIEEERTQIGTMKALGYGEGAIIRKYLLYAGSSAVIGCGLGVLAGSSVFPVILWDAYHIMLYVQPKICLTINWPLSLGVVGVYTAVILWVTWYCCHRTLREVPAELIRPKAPDAGRALLVEKLPFWNRISFLNKVTIRNIFRYRQRLAMMLVGISGCTALLVTGFGMRDTIVNVADYQYEDVSHYDMEVYFREGVDETAKAEFQKAMQPGMEYLLYHQSHVDLEYDSRVKEIYMISAGQDLKNFLDLHHGDTDIPMPGKNAAVLSAGTASALKINVGDKVILRDADMQSMEVTVSGIYDNYVYNYVIVLPETIQEQWGSLPEEQMAYIRLPQGANAHNVGAEIAKGKAVMNVSVCSDTLATVKRMMEAMDLVVLVIVFCAGLLAVTVLYNLTNININERIREIATIKVLGFNAAETSSYVFKENMALTLAGAVLGLGLGKLLLRFVISQIRIDAVWFKCMVLPASYGYAFALTVISALVVNFVFYFKLQKINMAEALKSVE
mgnify:FL=1